MFGDNPTTDYHPHLGGGGDSSNSITCFMLKKEMNC